jgi:hypothetical protein
MYFPPTVTDTWQSLARAMYPDDHDFWTAGCDFKHPQLKGSYNYHEWRRNMLAHLKFFGVDSALDRSKDIRRRRQQDFKDAKHSVMTSESADAVAVIRAKADDMEEESNAREPLDLAQSAIYLSLCDNIRTRIQFPWKNAAALWDCLWEEYGTPNALDISRAHRALFPMDFWEEGEDIPGNILEQQRAAVVLNAAGIPVSDVLVRMQHLRYLPSSFAHDHSVHALNRYKPDKLETHHILSAIDEHLEHFASPTRLDRCYYHNTDRHKVGQCREIRSHIKQVRKRRGKSWGDEAVEDKLVDGIFERYIGRVWKCKEHDTNDHHDEWCAVQLKKRLH